ncbi:hypothetical protein HHI_09048 [Hyphomonas hirschiana VP5]|nr:MULTISPECIES: hypothetical protein [Hyphomonas]KCZ94930.1 hypothetical protein HHI_09048 [Hyphomonas hirschiana VP5]
MSRRRKIRRFDFETLAPEDRASLLAHMGAPRWMLARAERAATPVRIAALLYPARWPGGRAPFNT